MKEAAEGKIPVERERVAGVLDRWLEHIEARGRAPKTLLENKRMAFVITGARLRRRHAGSGGRGAGPSPRPRP